MSSSSLREPPTCQYNGCGQAFRRRADLLRHITVVHLKNTQRTCPVDDCRQRLNRPDSLKTHLENIHGLGSPTGGDRRNQGIRLSSTRIQRSNAENEPSHTQSAGNTQSVDNTNSPFSQNPMHFPPIEPYAVLTSQGDPVNTWAEASEQQSLGNTHQSTAAQEVITMVPMSLSEYTGYEANVDLMNVDAEVITEMMLWCQPGTFPSSDDPDSGS